VNTALADPDPGDSIVVELARLMEGCSENFRAHVERLGYIPDGFLHVKPQTAIEAVAMRLTTATIQNALAERDFYNPVWPTLIFRIGPPPGLVSLILPFLW